MNIILQREEKMSLVLETAYQNPPLISKMDECQTEPGKKNVKVSDDFEQETEDTLFFLDYL